MVSCHYTGLLICGALLLSTAGNMSYTEVDFGEVIETSEPQCSIMMFPSDGTIFMKDDTPIISIAVSGCPFSPVAADISLELGSDAPHFNWHLEHGLSDAGVDLELPSTLPDGEYRGSARISAPYSLLAPVHFFRATLDSPSLEIVFPIPGFVFGNRSAPWLQVLVSDAGHAARGVRQVNHLLHVTVDGASIGRMRNTNGRRIHLPPGVGDRRVDLEVLDAAGRHTGASASLVVSVAADAEDRLAGPPPTAGRGFEPACAETEEVCRGDSDCSGHGVCRCGPGPLVVPQTRRGRRRHAESTRRRHCRTPLPWEGGRGGGRPPCRPVAAFGSLAAGPRRARHRSARPAFHQPPSAARPRPDPPSPSPLSLSPSPPPPPGRRRDTWGGRGGACLCGGDWWGEACGHWVLAQPRFLPPADPAAAPSRCRQALHRAALVAAPLRRAAAAQARGRCGIEGTLVQVGRGKPRDPGMAWLLRDPAMAWFVEHCAVLRDHARRQP